MTLDPKRWKELEPELDELLDLSIEARAARLREIEAEDPRAAEEIRLLLRSAETSSRRSDAARESAFALLSSAVHERGDAEVEGRRLGPYRLVRALGEGGMSVVYLAERVDGVLRQEVAVKVLRWTAGPEGAERFRLEQTTLARLDHPGVIRIFDAGVTEDGLPYFVMERVQGAPITRQAAERRLSARERVRLFHEVCDAVHAAHQSLVVHRDLKPSNVLVTPEGHVKVLDFGVAKWIEEEAEPQAPVLTGAGGAPFTPQYASPEQFLGRPITTASDVYSLGVLLYELLSGRLPYDLQGKPFTEQQRIVCEETPKPSSEATTDAETRRLLEGDLGRIVGRCLAKEPERRYASAAALAEDLERWLDGKPVAAVPDSLLYRTRRFVARNRIGVAAGAVALLALATGFAGTWWQAQEAARERDRARLQARRSEAVTDFLIESLEQANPYESLGGEITVRELLEKSVERVEHLSDQPELQVSLYTTMIETLSHMGRRARAESLGLRAVALADSIHGPGSPEAGRVRYHLARVQGHERPEAAMETLRFGERHLRERSDDEARLVRADLLEEIGNAHDGLAELDSAIAYQRRALSIREAVHDSVHSDLARSHHHLAMSLSSRGDAEASRQFALAAELWRATLGERHPNYSATLNNWAFWHQREGRLDSAEVFYTRALEADRRTLGTNSRPFADRLNNLANVSIQRGRPEAAVPRLRQAISILERDEGGSVSLGAARVNLGHALLQQGRLEAAEREYGIGRGLFVRVYGEGHPFAAIVDAYLGRLYGRTGRPGPARERFERALAVFERVHPAAVDRRVQTLTWFGRLLDENGDPEGLRYIEEARALAASSLPEGSAAGAEAAIALGAVLGERDEWEHALALVETGLAQLRGSYGPAHPLIREAERLLERLRETEGRGGAGRSITRGRAGDSESGARGRRRRARSRSRGATRRSPPAAAR